MKKKQGIVVSVVTIFILKKNNKINVISEKKIKEKRNFQKK